MPGSRGFRFWVEVALGSVSALLLALTLNSHDWLERLLGFEPDGGDGSAEWGLALAFSVATLLFLVDAGRLWWRRARA
jgi:hypothetical protein